MSAAWAGACGSAPLLDMVTGGRVDWSSMPANFDHFHYPGFDFAVPNDPAQYRQRLGERFPSERDAIATYFRDVRGAADWYGLETWSWSARAGVRASLAAGRPRARRLALMTTGDYLNTHFRDPKLRALLASQWGDYGLPPAHSAFGSHALIVHHYRHGAWFPVGGSEALAEAAREEIEAHGGSCRINHEVTEVVIENGRAVGVRAHVKVGRGGRDEVFRAPLVVSDAGAQTTYASLLPDGVADSMRAAVAASESSMTALTLYQGLTGDPARLGFQGENHWIFTTWDHQEIADRWAEALDGRPLGAYLSFPSMKDPTATRHTAEIITFARADGFAPWAGTEWMRRGETYAAMKARVAAGLLDVVEQRWPGFGALVDVQEVSTPLTVESFTGHRAGGIYGLASTPDRLRRRLTPAKTPVPGLLLAGADACALGVMGAVMGGVFAAGAALGPAGFPRIMGAASKRASQAQSTR